MKKTASVSVIIPIFNEKESLQELFLISEKFFSKRGEPVEYVCIDDGSTDGSFEALCQIKKQISSRMVIIKFRKNLGKSAALSAGFLHASGSIIITIDADLQDDPNELESAIEKIKKNELDFVVGWRKNRSDIKGKIRLSHIFNAVVSNFFHVSLHDMNCGLKVMKKEVAKEMDLYGELHRYIPVLAASRGFRVGEVVVSHHGRKFGSSKFGSERIVRAAFDLVTTLFITSFKSRPMHMFGLASVIVGLGGMLPLIYLTILHFLGISIGRRPLLLFGVMMVLCAVQLFSTGLLAELLVNLHGKNDEYPAEKIIS